MKFTETPRPKYNVNNVCCSLKMPYHVASLTIIVSNQPDLWMSGLDACLSGFSRVNCTINSCQTNALSGTTQKLIYLVAMEPEEGRTN